MGRIRAVMRRGGLVLAVAAVASAWAVSSCGGGSAEGDAAAADRELRRRVEEMIPRIAELARLPVERVPDVRRTSQANLEAYLLDRLESEYPGDSLENLQLAYRMFGLIPDTVEIRSLLVDLLLEQAIGYYDPARDVFFVRDDAPKEMLEAVLAHELVHALQDQQADLDSLTRSRPWNDGRMAVQAAMEGHATLVMLAHQLGLGNEGGLSIEDLPEISPEMAGALVNASSYPRLAGAPAIVREPLLFAYLGGGRYVQRLWRSVPEKPAPFGRWLPESTEQLIHTERILEERDDPTRLELSDAGGGWETRYTGDLGELEIRIYFEEHVGSREIAARAAAGWDGDVYALLARNGDLALVWYTVWDSGADAEEFAEAYRQAFQARFGEAGGSGGGERPDRLVGRGREARLERLTVAGMAAVRVVETPRGVSLEGVPEARAVGGGR